MQSPSSTPSTLIRYHCNHTVLSAVFKVCSFVLVGEKNNTQDNICSDIIHGAKPYALFAICIITQP